MRVNRSIIAFISTSLIISAFWGCNSLSEKEIEYRQSFESGKVAYHTRCANCHKPNGEGMGTLYPPLSHSDYLKTHLQQLPCIIFSGLKGPISVNGSNYNWEMPANKTIDEIEMSAILTYVQSRWGYKKEAVSYEEARKDINACVAGISRQESGVRR